MKTIRVKDILAPTEGPIDFDSAGLAFYVFKYPSLPGY
jgi:hypothetical protein